MVRLVAQVMGRPGDCNHHEKAHDKAGNESRDKKAAGDSITIVRVASIGSFSFEKINIRDLKL